MPASTHSILFKFGERLGYELTGDGLCKGISVKWSEACLLGPVDVERFTERVKMIPKSASDQRSLISEIKEINQKVTRHEPLTERDLLLLEIPAMYEGIILHLLPEEHSAIFGKRLNQGDIDQISEVTASVPMEKRGGLITIHQEVGIYNGGELAAYLKELREVIEESKQNVAILLSNDCHTMSLYYDIESQSWTIMDINEWPPFVSKNDEDIVDRISKGFAVTPTTQSQFTPMHTQVIVPKKNPENTLAEQLFSDLKKRHLADMTPEKAARVENINLVWLAACFGDMDTLLAARDINPNLQDSKGVTPLYIAAQNGDIDVVKALLAAKDINPNLQSYDGVTPLYIAAQNGHINAVTALLAAQDIDPNLADSTDTTPLYIAAEKGHLNVVEALLAAKDINPNLADSTDTTPLYIAAQKGHIDVVNALLAAKDIDPNLADSTKTTPLYIAAQNGHIDVVNALLAAQDIDPNPADSIGTTPLFIAAQKGHIDVVRALFAKGVSLNQRDPNGNTLLAMAKSNSHHDIVEFIQRNAIPDATVDPDTTKRYRGALKDVRSAGEADMAPAGSPDRIKDTPAF